MKTVIVTSLVMIGLLGSLHAQSMDGLMVNSDSSKMVDIRYVKNQDLKRPSKAVVRSLTHTVIPIGLALAIYAAAPPKLNLFSDEESENGGSFMFMLLGLSYGAFIGPSMGNLYARDYISGVVGIALRIQGYRMTSTLDSSSRRTKQIGNLLLFGSALYNILSGPASVRRYNHRQKVQIAPSVDPGTQVPMLSVRLSF